MIVVKTNIDKVVSSLKADLASFYKGGENYNACLRAVASSTLGQMQERIHEQGKASGGEDIGQYSAKPIYVNPKESPKKFTPLGKNKKAKFKSGKPKQTRYFADGYKGFKTFIGRNILGKVNLSLSGQLNKQWTLQPTSDGWGLGWADAEKYNRAKGFEKKYHKPIYDLTKEEIENVEHSANDYIDAIFKGTDNDNK